MKGPFYVTTPIYYVNDVPHLGTAYTTIAADALRRYALLRGRETRMLTGTDEHGLKIERRAAEENLTPVAFADRVSQGFREAWPELRVEADDFIRTTEPRHAEFVQDFWQRIAAKGFIYEGTYDEWYCVGCESFKTEKELLPGNLCAIHLTPVERLKEETYFFQLSAFQERLLAFYEARPDFIRPESRKNEVVSFVSSGLKDLSVSRTSFQWGVPVPGDPKHVMYVWFDALSNYLSALGGPDGALGRFWPPRAEAVHVMGKDILRFHAVYWPAFLLAAGYTEEQLPTAVYAHGFLTVDGQKMSKSLRNAVDPRKLARVLGADSLRYHLLRAISFGQDGDFSHEALLERYNADLGKNLGNLLSRTLGLCTKFFGSTVPPWTTDAPLETELAQAIAAELERAGASWDRYEPHQALEATFTVSSLLNQYIDRAAPWAAAKSDLPRAGHVLHTILRELARLSAWLWPAIPDKADALRAQLGLAALRPERGLDQFESSPSLHVGDALSPGAPLFPTYDKERIEALLSELKPPKSDEQPKDEPPPTIRLEVSESAALVELPPVAYDEFARIDLRAGLVTAAERVPKKDKLLKLAVDVGEAEPRQIVAGLALTFAPDELVGRRVIVVANLAPRDFGKGPRVARDAVGEWPVRGAPARDRARGRGSGREAQVIRATTSGSAAGAESPSVYAARNRSSASACSSWTKSVASTSPSFTASPGFFASSMPTRGSTA